MMDLFILIKVPVLPSYFFNQSINRLVDQLPYLLYRLFSHVHDLCLANLVLYFIKQFVVSFSLPDLYFVLLTPMVFIEPTSLP